MGKYGVLICELKNRKGKIKELYENGYVKFEGEYINGKINGKGREYDSDGNLIFEGEYLNGKRNGKGKKFYGDFGDLLIEGEYK